MVTNSPQGQTMQGLEKLKKAHELHLRLVSDSTGLLNANIQQYIYKITEQV